ncbi:MAG: preprotein translocase subunit SecA [Hyphomicrobiaceae bacterium]|nr:preprotein translocase subunit SecA [Hyphomicrobiaceae bacterium]
MISFKRFATRIFGSSNERCIRNYSPRVDAINALEPEIELLSDDELRSRTTTFREQISNGTNLQDLIIPAFATVREAAKRTLGQRHFDVQLIGGMALHEGKIAEMKTGEGKTLVSTLPVYLNALTQKGVHVVTVNDYLAQRDAKWMGQVYNFLGLTVDCIINDMDDGARQAAYLADITYGTNNEYGFDYLRDNMKLSKEEMVQRGHNFAIIDEVDSILIDEARTPLVISGPLEDRAELYKIIDKYIPELITDERNFELDEKQRQISLTENGNQWVEEKLKETSLLRGTLYDIENVTIVHHINQALKAHKLFTLDKDYIIRDNEVIIIDEHTGRMMPGRRYSEGLHQALEAKEDVTIQPENQTLASITFQNYFRLYCKLAGMTGTASTEAAEFLDIYGLDVLEIPTHRPVGRLDEDDEIYRTESEKWQAIISEVKDAQKRFQPCLVGTASIEKSEHLSNLLKENNVVHQVLNARYHEQEAKIIAQAGAPGAVTIATNMAGRGTDIQLGGNAEVSTLNDINADSNALAETKKIESKITDAREQVLKASATIEIEPAKGKKAAKTIKKPGGLYVIGTERHESRRIDNQLRGRSGRQGDPGRSKFYLSLQDDLMRIFGSGKMDSVLKTIGLREGEAIIHPIMSKTLEMAQKKVEARNFDMRKHILKYDDVMNEQRKVVYEQRHEFMSTNDVSEIVIDMRHDVIDSMVKQYIPEKTYPEQWDLISLDKAFQKLSGTEYTVKHWTTEVGIANEDISYRLIQLADSLADAKIIEVGEVILESYGNAKQLEAFVDGDEKLQKLLNQPEKNFDHIGQYLLDTDTNSIYPLEGSKGLATDQISMIGYQFFVNLIEARQLTSEIDSAEDKSPNALGRKNMRYIEKSVLIQTLDNLWREHLVMLEHLREVIGFRAYGQRDPLAEYKSEAFMLFDNLLSKLRETVTQKLMTINVQDNNDPTVSRVEIQRKQSPLIGDYAKAEAALRSEALNLATSDNKILRQDPLRTRQASMELDPNDPSTWGKISRNALCPCGSGKKYKRCHGKFQ